jgi:hypothetical protein
MNPASRQFLALVYLEAKDRVSPLDLPMKARTAQRVLHSLAKDGLATGDADGSYQITAEGRAALAAAREEARREAGI